MIFFISYLFWFWGRGKARFSFETWAVREHLQTPLLWDLRSFVLFHMITGSSQCASSFPLLEFSFMWKILAYSSPLFITWIWLPDFNYMLLCLCWMCNSRVSDISFQTGWSFCSREHCQVWKENGRQRWSCNNNGRRWPNQVYLFCCTISPFCSPEYLQFKENLHTLNGSFWSNIILLLCDYMIMANWTDKW